MERRRIMLPILILAVIALDQWTKALVRTHLQSPRVYLDGLITLVFTQNEGAFLSLGSSLSPC